VIVIGSGAAGIGAGVTLSRNGLKYVVLEARERIGGRIMSTKVSEIELDMGACWVHSYSKANPICK
jgi:polyamine oxidase